MYDLKNILNINYNMQIPIIVYSDNYVEHARSIIYKFRNCFNLSSIFEVNFEIRICQHDKNPKSLLESLEYYNESSYCYIVVADINNSLGDFVCANSCLPVIFSPFIHTEYQQFTFNVSSDKIGIAPMFVFGCENTALTIAKMITPNGTYINEYHNNNRQKIRILDIVTGHNSYTIDEKSYEDIVTSKNNTDYLLTHAFVRKGKVRDIYESNDETVILSASDRLSAFDRIICNIPHKGAVLNRISTWWFKQTEDIVPNHLIEVLNDTDIKVKKCRPILIEFVVRGYITGNSKTSIWKNYSDGCSTYCGHVLPRGLVKNQKLESPLVTPTTKGKSDELISSEHVVKSGILM